MGQLNITAYITIKAACHADPV